MSYHIIRSELSASAAGGPTLPKSSDFCHVGTAQLDNWRWKVQNFTLARSLSPSYFNLFHPHTLSLKTRHWIYFHVPAALWDVWASWCSPQLSQLYATRHRNSFCSIFNALTITPRSVRNHNRICTHSYSSALHGEAPLTPHSNQPDLPLTSVTCRTRWEEGKKQHIFTFLDTIIMSFSSLILVTSWL